jgi:hypothetical protein
MNSTSYLMVRKVVSDKGWAKQLKDGLLLQIVYEFHSYLMVRKVDSDKGWAQQFKDGLLLQIVYEFNLLPHGEGSRLRQRLDLAAQR